MKSARFATLIAKSRSNDEDHDPPRIDQHCVAVRDAAEAIWDSIENDLAASLASDAPALREQIRPLFLVAAILHDVAKANSAFQEIVRKASQRRQPVRHEILAAVMLMDERFWGKWFAETLPNERDRWAVAWAVGGHHLQLRERRFGDTEDPIYRTGNIPRFVELYADDGQVTDLLRRARECLAPDADKCKGFAPLRDETFDPLDDSEIGLERTVRRFVRQSQSQWREFQHDPTFKLQLALLKVLLIAADVAGSAALPEGEEMTSRIRVWLAAALQKFDAKQIYESDLNGSNPHDFQLAVAASESLVTVVAAGCGNGKTTAAYMWGEKWSDGRKLFFAYPTTGTASAGFEDYLFAQSNLERDLIHSRADADLRSMWDSAGSDESPIERAQRLESLRAWGQQVVACTVDTVLGLIQSQRRPLYAFPAIVRGAFVFDEVHSYDRRLFAELLRFLETFPGVPVLIMSASIPPNRLEALKRAAKGRINEIPVEGDKAIENVERYRIQWRDGPDQCWSDVEEALHGRQKVLWVCNTVNDAIAVFRQAEQLKERINGLQTVLYHSRFRYGGNPPVCAGRVELQKRVIEEFAYVDQEKTRRRHPRPAIAVTTQVCEMSLNISADLLVTALCPLPSLVQRLGRLNRFARSRDPKPAYAYPFAGRPYQEEDFPAQLEAARTMIDELGGAALTQATLGGYIRRMQSNEDWSETLHSAWLDGGWQSQPLPAREGDNTLTVLREEDIAHLPADARPRDVIPWTIPMLLKRGFIWERQMRGYAVAPRGSVLYDETVGASWGAS